MERNLNILKGRLLCKVDALLTVNDRSGEVILISAAVISIRGENRVIPKSAPKISTQRFTVALNTLVKGHMADIDHRKSLKIFHIRDRRDNIIVIRNKFRMHAGFFIVAAP